MKITVATADTTVLRYHKAYEDRLVLVNQDDHYYIVVEMVGSYALLDLSNHIVKPWVHGETTIPQGFTPVNYKLEVIR